MDKTRIKELRAEVQEIRAALEKDAAEADADDLILADLGRQNESLDQLMDELEARIRKRSENNRLRIERLTDINAELDQTN